MRIFASKSGKGWVVPANGKINCFSIDSFPTMDAVRAYIKKNKGVLTGGQGLGESVLFGYALKGEDLGVELTKVQFKALATDDGASVEYDEEV